MSMCMKAEILRRDNYKCIICGRSEKDGVELRVDHIKPKDRGAKITVANGVTLCSQHDFMKENSDLTETAKRMFICLYELAKKREIRRDSGFLCRCSTNLRRTRYKWAYRVDKVELGKVQMDD